MTSAIGLVVAAHGRHVVIQTAQGRLLAHPRGKRLEAVVGDHVHWQPAGDEAVIDSVAPRRNLLFRQDAWRTKSFAANLDAVLVLVAADPPFSEQMLARALIAAQAADLPAWVVLNKIDLPADAARARLAPLGAAGVEVVELSLKNVTLARTLLGPRLRGRTTLLLGPSGAGKSTLVNLLVPNAGAQVGEISQALRSGRHTTTATRWYALGDPRGQQGITGGDAGDDAATGAGAGERPDGAALIDSPGFQEFGLHHVQPEALAHHMPDLRAHLGHCRFANCTHRQEPGCGVRAAVEDGRLAASRWAMYVQLYDELVRARTTALHR
jgi:ribosome biogenesis GTPase